MKKGILLNTNKLGGAERSIIEQLCLVQDENLEIFIPDIGGDDAAMLNLLNERGFNKISKYPYPSGLYRLSRTGLLNPLRLLSLVSFPFYLFKWSKVFRDFDLLYLNGLKAALPVLIISGQLKRKPKIVWHFRDYPAPKLFSIIGWYLRKRKAQFENLTLVSNSYSVETEVSKYLPGFTSVTIYNLPGNLENFPSISQVKTVGLASMFAPWKGIHEVIWMFGLYQNEIRELGIEKLKIFGGNIYSTNGAHSTYDKEIKKLVKKLNLGDFIEFRGVCTPQEIFSEIDVLIHSSIEPEPFGRIIVEAFKSGRPVLSTGIGGAGELVIHNQTGLTFDPSDYDSMFMNLKTLCEKPTKMISLVEAAKSSWSQKEENIAASALVLLRT